MCVCTDPQELAANSDGFQKVFTKFLADRRVGNSIQWDKIQPLLKDSVISYPRVDVPRGEAKVLLDKLVVLKLNGRLGTSMGCVGPKNLISVRSDHTFLDLTVEQIEVRMCVCKCALFWYVCVGLCECCFCV